VDNCERRVLRRSWYVPGSSLRPPRRQHVVLRLLQGHPPRANFSMKAEFVPVLARCLLPGLKPQVVDLVEQIGGGPERGQIDLHASPAQALSSRSSARA
jgi:hypothetical protein